MNSGHFNAIGPGSRIEAIAQFLVTRASSRQISSGSTSFNRQVIVQDQPHYPGIKPKPGEAKPVIQDLSEKMCTLTTLENHVAGRQGQQSSGSDQAGPSHNLYPFAECQHSQTNEQQCQSSKAALSLKERKVFQCTFDGCNKKYTRNFTLKNHLLIHTGDKPFQCEYAKCEKRL